MTYDNQIKEIREHLEKVQNPVFFFDNDADGLCSFLLLRKFLGAGRGVCVKGELSADYFRKIEEFSPDYVFILDKGLVSLDFYEKLEEVNLPVVCIDHHNFSKEDVPDFVNYYNPLLEGEKNIPVTYFCYEATKRKEDLWIACTGCIADKFVPPFYSEFEEKYPDLSSDYEDAFDLRFRAGVGKIIRMFNFALKDRTSNVIKLLKFLVNVRTPYEIFDEGSENYYMHKRFNFIDKKYQVLLKRALDKDRIGSRLLFFKYGGDMSISCELADELSYMLQDKLVVVAYQKDSHVNISVRGEGALRIFREATKGLEGVGGGGHEKSVGVRMRAEFLGDFEKNLRRIVGS